MAKVIEGEQQQNKDDDKEPLSCFQRYLRGPGPAYSLVFVDFFGLGTIYPLLPVFCKDFENGGMWLGAILSAQSAGVIIGTVLVGILSDMFGRKRLGLYSMFGDGIFFFLAGMMTNPLGMLIVRLICGIFSPIPCSYSWIIDLTPDKNQQAKRIGFTTAFILGGLFFGSVVAGVAGEFFGITIAMIIPSAAAFINLFIIAMFVPTPEGDLAKKEKVQKPNPGPVLKTPTFKSLALVNVGIGSMLGHYTAVGMNMMVRKHGLTPAGLSGFNVSTMFVMILANAKFFPWAYRVLGADKMIPMFIMIAATGFTCAFFAEFNLWVFFAVSLPSFLFGVTVMPSTQTVAAVLTKKIAPDAVGTVQGLSRMTVEIGKCIGPIISMTLYGNGDGNFVAYLWVGILLYIGAIIYCACGKDKTPEAFDEPMKNDEQDKKEVGI